MGGIGETADGGAGQASVSLLLYELRLIRSTLTASAVQSSVDQLNLEEVLLEEQPGSPSTLTQLMSAIEAVVGHVEAGEYVKAMEGGALRILFGNAASAELGNGPSDCFSFLKLQIDAFLSGQRHQFNEPVPTAELQARSILALAVGVAALLSFTQANKTGYVILLLFDELLFIFSFIARFYGLDQTTLFRVDPEEKIKPSRCKRGMAKNSEANGRTGPTGSSWLMDAIFWAKIQFRRFVLF